MFEKLNILDEKDKRLRVISKEAKLPLSLEYKKLVERMITELRYSQIEEYSEKYHLRPGMGLAFPQIGINERHRRRHPARFYEHGYSPCRAEKRRLFRRGTVL